IRADGWFHREVGEHLKQVVLDDVAHSADLFVERASSLNTEVLGHGDLHALDVGTVPERFKQLIGEPEKEHAVNGPFSQIVIDSINVRFVECLEENVVQFTSGGQVPPKRLFDDDSGVAGATGLRQSLDDGAEGSRGYGEVIRRVLCRADFLTQG